MPNFTYTVDKVEAVTTVEEFIRECVDVPRFLPFCQACPNYGTRWACPPFEFDPMEVWGQYQTLRLYARILTPSNDDGEALIAALRQEKEVFCRELLAMEQAKPKSQALACGSCGACKSCARAEGKPCRFPEQLRSSIEALGGDVDKTAQRYFGRELLWVKDGKAPDYLMLVGGLLLKEAL